jgi:hypothetical protein
MGIPSMAPACKIQYDSGISIKFQRVTCCIVSGIEVLARFGVVCCVGDLWYGHMYGHMILGGDKYRACLGSCLARKEEPYIEYIDHF